MRDERRLLARVEDIILNVANASPDLTTSDLQGITTVAAHDLIALIKQASKS